MTTTTSAELGFAGLVSSAARPAGPVIRWALLAGIGVLACVACLLVWRRAVGALSSPLPAAALATVGLVAALAAAAVRAAWLALYPRRASAAVWGTVTVSVVLSAIAVSLPESPLWGTFLLWAAIVAEEGWAWRPGPFRGIKPAGIEPVGSPRPPQPVAEWAIHEPPRENVTQQLTRIEEPDGTEKVQGWLRTTFGAGQRFASVHVAFCPPFSQGPEANLKQLAGPEVRIKKVQVFPFGARFDLKLAVPAETHLEVLLQFTAEASGKEPSEGAGGRPARETGDS